MDQNHGQIDSSKNNAKIDNQIKKQPNGEKCNHCVFSGAGNLRAHLKIHSGEKSNKCNQCDYASSQAGSLRKHLRKRHGNNL